MSRMFSISADISSDGGLTTFMLIEAETKPFKVISWEVSGVGEALTDDELVYSVLEGVNINVSAVSGTAADVTSIEEVSISPDFTALHSITAITKDSFVTLGFRISSYTEGLAVTYNKRQAIVVDVGDAFSISVSSGQLPNGSNYICTARVEELGG